jgi:cell division protein FtsQ
VSTSVGEPVGAEPRLTRRRRSNARARGRRLFFRGAVAVFVAASLWAAFWSPLLRVRDVKVIGGRHVSAADVGTAAGLGSSDNLLTLSTSDVARRVASLAWVKDARVERVLPGTVVVTVVERRPAVILTVAARRWTLDARGRVLAPGAAAGGLPVVTVFEAPELRAGARVRGGPAGAALRALRSLPRSLRAEVVAAFAPTLERISFSLRDRLLIRFGAAERLRAKGHVLRALLRRLRAEGRSVAYLDVRVPESPAVSDVPPAASGEGAPPGGR